MEAFYALAAQQFHGLETRLLIQSLDFTLSRGDNCGHREIVQDDEYPCVQLEDRHISHVLQILKCSAHTAAMCLWQLCCGSKQQSAALAGALLLNYISDILTSCDAVELAKTLDHFICSLC